MYLSVREGYAIVTKNSKFSAAYNSKIKLYVLVILHSGCGLTLLRELFTPGLKLKEQPHIANFVVEEKDRE